MAIGYLKCKHCGKEPSEHSANTAMCSVPGGETFYEPVEEGAMGKPRMTFSGWREPKEPVRVVVPEGGLGAAVAAAWKHTGFDSPQCSPQIQKDIKDGYRAGLEAFVRWLSENPMFPTHAEVESILAMVQFQGLRGTSLDGLQDFAAMWQRRCFLAPEPEVPEAVKDLMWPDSPSCSPTIIDAQSINKRVLEAYRRGQRSKDGQR